MSDIEENQPITASMMADILKGVGYIENPELIAANAKQITALSRAFDRCDQTSIDGLNSALEILVKTVKLRTGANDEEVAYYLNLRRTEGKITLNRCEVRDSPISGKGVFATQNIKRGEVVTLYPRDIFCFVLANGKTRYHIPNSHSYFKTNEDCQVYDFGSYEYVYVGDPTMTDNPAFLAHMINDRVKYKQGHPVGLYLNVSYEYCNVQFLQVADRFVAAVACKDIAVNQEILVTYGVDYWLTQK